MADLGRMVGRCHRLRRHGRVVAQKQADQQETQEAPLAPHCGRLTTMPRHAASPPPVPVMAVVLVDDRVAPTAADQPVVGREGGDERDTQRHC
jgi:hypothetical protein